MLKQKARRINSTGGLSSCMRFHGEHDAPYVKTESQAYEHRHGPNNPAYCPLHQPAGAGLAPFTLIHAGPLCGRRHSCAPRGSRLDGVMESAPVLLETLEKTLRDELLDGHVEPTEEDVEKTHPGAHTGAQHDGREQDPEERPHGGEQILTLLLVHDAPVDHLQEELVDGDKARSCDGEHIDSAGDARARIPFTHVRIAVDEVHEGCRVPDRHPGHGADAHILGRPHRAEDELGHQRRHRGHGQREGSEREEAGRHRMCPARSRPRRSCGCGIAADRWSIDGVREADAGLDHRHVLDEDELLLA
mmetsp:Transcript_12387/g.35081  ORF Transcript_12387/g.35081 Transcript_12387/m.35081 type:complete len:304 (+) Transcript_12387:181-1092(+)